MDYLPMFLDVRQQPCLVVGGGEVAARKVETLLRSQAAVSVMAPALCDELAALRDRGEIEHLASPFLPAPEPRYALIVAATDDLDVNRRVAGHARAQHIPVNVVDRPELCTFIMPAIIDRDPLVVAVSSAGASPVLARRLRSRIESSLPAAYGRFARLLGSLRSAVKARFAELDQRRRFWETVIDGPIAERFYAGDEDGARDRIEALLEETAAAPAETGEVYLIGAGPGDPELLTLKALRLMQQAEVVLYDRLVSAPVLDRVRKDAQRVFVGKRGADRDGRQDDIVALMLEHARAGKRVLRLKGGDPMLFGRGFEEIEPLAAAGITFQVVPGITAATGCAAYAGIPLTHRELAPAVVLITAHRVGGEFRMDTALVARAKQTVVFYMAGSDPAPLCAWLVQHGRAADTPAAIVERGTLPQQRVVRGTLRSLADGAAGTCESPALMIVGEVVALAPGRR